MWKSSNGTFEPEPYKEGNAVDYNKVILGGRLVEDPQMKTLVGGDRELSLALFSVGVNTRYRTGEKFREETLFVDCVVFGSASLVLTERFKKGDPIFLEGRLRLDRWEKDGEKRQKHRVVVKEFGSPRGSSKPLSKDLVRADEHHENVAV